MSKTKYCLTRQAYNDGYTEHGEIILGYIYDDLDEYKDKTWGYIETNPRSSDDPFTVYLRKTYPVIFEDCDKSDRIYAHKIVFYGKAI